MPQRQRRMSGEARREHLLDTAASLLVQHGFEAVTMEAIRERAGISRGLAYTHFENAEELVFALYEREMTELERRLDEMGDTGATFDDRVRAATRVYFDFIVDRGGLLATLQMKLPQRWFKPSVRERLVRLLRYWSDAIERELGVTTDHARALARACLAATEMIALALRSNVVVRADAERLSTDFVLGGLRAIAKSPA
jgi:AcrR family transcriptional regulator